jgi:reprolysin-like metallo-peptidase family M12B
MSLLRRSARPAALSLLAGTLVVGALVAAGPAPAVVDAAPSLPPATAPGFLVPSSARGATLPQPRSVEGTSSLVTLDTTLLPRHAEGQSISFDLGRQAVTGRFTHIEHNPDFTAWTGSLDVYLGSFTIVRSGSVYRVALTSPQGVWAVTQARGSQYWLTAVAPYPGPASGDDTVTSADAGATTPSLRLDRTTHTATSQRGQSRIDVLFAYTPSAKLAAGGSKAGIKAAVGQAAAATNLTLSNSGIKAKIKVKGIIRVSGKEGSNVIKDFRRLQRPHDGMFDSAIKARTKRHADIVHLFTGGPSDQLCGAGAIPRTLGEAGPLLGVSTSYVSCLPYLVTTHELGHNLGADHISYPGVTHYSKMPGSYGWYDQPHHFLTMMGYYEPCQDVGDYTCVRIPYFSNPTGNYAGFAIGSKEADNADVVSKFAPRVARYAR